MTKLDYTITSPQERNELVYQILSEIPEPSPAYLETLANYLIIGIEKNDKKILNENRLLTINKRETSYEGLAAQLENGENGLYNISKNTECLFRPKIEITEQDCADIPELAEWRAAINFWEQKLHSISGRDAFIIKKMLIEMRKDQYIIKNAYKVPVGLKFSGGEIGAPLSLEDTTSTFDENGLPIPTGFSLMRPEVVSALLCNYSKLIEDSFEDFDGDMKYTMIALDELIDQALANEPLYLRLLGLKIDGVANITIQQILQEEFGIKHSLEYISMLWRKKIPYLIASAAIDQYLDYYYREVEKGTYKKCSKCGAIKLANKKYFNLNSGAKDGLYSICKECRRK